MLPRVCQEWVRRGWRWPWTAATTSASLTISRPALAVAPGIVSRKWWSKPIESMYYFGISMYILYNEVYHNCVYYSLIETGMHIQTGSWRGVILWLAWLEVPMTRAESQRGKSRAGCQRIMAQRSFETWHTAKHPRIWKPKPRETLPQKLCYSFVSRCLGSDRSNFTMVFTRFR